MLKRKITITQAFALLKVLGAPVAEIVSDEKDADTDYSQDEAIDAVDQSRTPILEPKLRETITEEVKGAVAGKSAGTVRTLLARLTGVKRSDLEGMDEEAMVQKSLDHYNSNSSKSTEDLRKQITELSEAHTKALDEKEADAAAKIKAAQDRYTERDIDAALIAEVSKVPRSGGDPAAQARLWKTTLRDKYHLHYNEAKGQVEFRKKDNPELPALNDAGNLPVNVTDSAMAFLKDMGVAASDTRGKNPFDTIPKGGADATKTTGADDDSLKSQAANIEALFAGE